jgi:hypothetical protein
MWGTGPRQNVPLKRIFTHTTYLTVYECGPIESNRLFFTGPFGEHCILCICRSAEPRPSFKLQKWCIIKSMLLQFYCCRLLVEMLLRCTQVHMERVHVSKKANNYALGGGFWSCYTQSFSSLSLFLGVFLLL